MHGGAHTKRQQDMQCLCLVLMHVALGVSSASLSGSNCGSPGSNPSQAPRDPGPVKVVPSDSTKYVQQLPADVHSLHHTRTHRRSVAPAYMVMKGRHACHCDGRLYHLVADMRVRTNARTEGFLPCQICCSPSQKQTYLAAQGSRIEVGSDTYRQRPALAGSAVDVCQRDAASCHLRLHRH